MNINPLEGLPQFPLVLFFFFNLYSFLFSDLIISMIFSRSLILLHAHMCLWISLVNSSLKFFYFSAPEFLCDVLIFPLCSYIIFLTFSTSFSFSSIFNTVFQSHSLVDLPSGLCHWTLSVVLFFEIGILPCFLMCLVIFFPENLDVWIW